VEVQVPSFEMVDQARRCLGLGETITTAEIKQAYRRCAGQLHPDHNPNTPDTEARMAELTRAYQYLTAYAESQTLLQAGEHGDGAVEVHRSQRSKDHSSPLASRPPCMFTRQAVEQTLLIAIQRQEVMA
jgi:DnaJ-class molecular chaperone